MVQADPGAERRQSLGGGRDRITVTVEADQPEAGMGAQERLRVPAAAQVGVHEDTGRHRAEHLDDLVHHHRVMREGRHRRHGRAAR